MCIFHAIFIEVYIFVINRLPLLTYIEHDITCHLNFTFLSQVKKKFKRFQGWFLFRVYFL